PQNPESHPLAEMKQGPRKAAARGLRLKEIVPRAMAVPGGVWGPKSGSCTIMGPHQAQESSAKLAAPISFGGTNYCTAHIDRERIVHWRPRFFWHGMLRLRKAAKGMGILKGRRM